MFYGMNYTLSMEADLCLAIVRLSCKKVAYTKTQYITAACQTVASCPQKASIKSVVYHKVVEIIENNKLNSVSL